MLKAIETEYNGYHFRSRLEARWAVFFDTLGIKYGYEKEGYDLGGLWYLPDFWLPDLECWVEIKGQEPTEEERMKCHRLMLHANARSKDDSGAVSKKRKDVFMFVGDIPFPDKNDRMSCYSAYAYSTMYPELSPMPNKGYKDFGWVECPFCHTIGITLRCSIKWLTCECEEMYIRINAIGAIIADKNMQKPWSYAFCHQGLMGDFVNKMEAFLSYHDTPRLIDAYTAARSARFEHKEIHNKLRQKVDANLEQISVLQTRVKPTLPDIHALTIEKVEERWTWIKKRCRTGKDGTKLATILEGYTFVGVEGTKELPVIVIQAKSNFFYKVIAEDTIRHSMLEWAAKTELKRECQVRLMRPTTDSLLSWDESDCDVCGIDIGTIQQDDATICQSCWEDLISKD